MNKGDGIIGQELGVERSDFIICGGACDELIEKRLEGESIGLVYEGYTGSRAFGPEEALQFDGSVEATEPSTKNAYAWAILGWIGGR